ncbi:hypothetical protein ACFRMQ_09720 [Kitasatospora sp. NPDC056783]|uniref:hypothetical protein n=1 Tax=Kitasatospora sp. NPDC056783 TaxID=3345943 RepID=UPI0036C967B9
MTLNGVDVVVLTPEQHAGPESARRQPGGARAQVGGRLAVDPDRRTRVPYPVVVEGRDGEREGCH